MHISCSFSQEEGRNVDDLADLANESQKMIDKALRKTKTNRIEEKSSSKKSDKRKQVYVPRVYVHVPKEMHAYWRSLSGGAGPEVKDRYKYSISRVLKEVNVSKEEWCSRLRSFQATMSQKKYIDFLASHNLGHQRLGGHPNHQKRQLVQEVLKNTIIDVDEEDGDTST